MLTTAIVSVLSASPFAHAQDNETSDEVIATGIRQSIEKGLDLKRNSDSIVDGAFAEELGKFPDTNVAESLQRITGVAITRSRGGEGQFVTVRGLGEEFNAVTYNGRLLATENSGREFSFDVIASELISAAEVYKSPTASQGDGSIGGLVNIRSALALDNPGFHGAGKVALQYESLADDFGLRASGVLSNTWANDTIGLLGSISYQQRDVRTDIAESIAIATNGGDVNGDGVNERLNSFAASVAQQDRERIGGTLAFQYAPDDDTELTIDGLYTSFTSPSTVNGYSFFPGFGGTVPGSLVFNDANQVIEQRSENIVADFVARENEADTETIAIGANFKKRLSDRLNSEWDLSWSQADGRRDNVGSAAGSGSFFVLGFLNGVFEQSPGGRVPNVNFTVAGTEPGAQQLEFGQLNNIVDDIRLHFARTSFTDVNDEVFNAQVDFDYELSGNSSITFGADFVNREKSNIVFDNVATQCGDANTIFLCGYPVRFSEFGDTSNLLTIFDDDFLGSISSDIPRQFPIFSIEALEQAYANIGTAFNIPSFLDTNFNPQQSNVVDETVVGGYVQANLDGQVGDIPFSLNAGVRVAYTDLTSTGVGASITGVAAQLPVSDPTGASSFTIDADTPINANNDYFDVLPSFNIAFDLNDNLKFRSAFSRSLTRPTLTDLSTFFDITSTNRGLEQIQSSNPLLEAVRSNNVDFSLEYYGESGLSITGAVFYKDISDFITNVNTTQNITIPNATDTMGNPIPDLNIDFLVSAPQNSDNAEVYGVELAAQYLFDNGLGVSGNVTLADSSATSGGVTSPLENISDLAANASVFYEANNIQARASVNHRGDFLATTAGEGGLSEIVDDFTQVDASFAYNIGNAFLDSETDLFIFVEGINILNEKFFRFSETPDLVETFEDNGARWTFGVRASF